ncbi:MAG: flagellar hook protein FlgE [Bacillota bacterium]
MMRSMFSAISGLSSHQARMDVIGNNIANVNTIGFKSSRATFAQAFSQTLSGASAPQAGRGGTNPQQIGLGAKLGSISTIFTQGTPERTDVPTDAMIAGDGFFVVSNDPNYTNRFYTRAGNFDIDSEGNLHLNGNMVLGYSVTEDSFGTSNPVYETELKKLVIDKSSTAPSKGTGVSYDGSAYPTITESGVVLGGNLDAGTTTPADYDLTVAGTQATYAALIGKAGGANISDLPEDAIARDLTYTVFDELGGEHEMRMIFVKGEGAGAGTNDWYVASVAEDGTLKGLGGFDFGADGKPTPTSLDIKVTYDADGNGTAADNELLPNGAPSFMFRVDFSSLTEYDNDSTVSVTDVEGYKSGGFDRFEIGADGIITAVYSNGVMSPIGRLAIANFTNPAGLSNQGGNLFGATPNSGVPSYGGPGQPGFASLMPGNLEMSNVDLSREFTNMIITQRGFQANSRIITTTDEMLQELTNLKR